MRNDFGVENEEENMNLLTMLLNKKFYRGTNKSLERANKLHQAKGNTVVCDACGNLELKASAVPIYNTKTGKMEYYHAKCCDEKFPCNNEQIAPKMDGHKKEWL